MDDRSLYDLWLDICYMLAGNDPFWAGVFATLSALLGLQLVVGSLRAVYAMWLHMRQFFEPTRQPGPMPTTPGPSPFSRVMGFLGAAIGLSVVIGVIVFLILRFR